LQRSWASSSIRCASSPDPALRALGRYKAWGKGTIYSESDGTLTLRYEHHIADRYNWDKGKAFRINGVSVTDEFMGEFHRQGLAREFDIHGFARKTFSWRPGTLSMKTTEW
jgi:hypothetical protein